MTLIHAVCYDLNEISVAVKIAHLVFMIADTAQQSQSVRVGNTGKRSVMKKIITVPIITVSIITIWDRAESYIIV